MNRKRTRFTYISIIVVVAFFYFNACKRSNLDIDVSAISVNSETHHFERILFENDSAKVLDKIHEMYFEHNDFIDIYTESIIKIGSVDYEYFSSNLNMFLADTVIGQVADTVLRVFSNMDDIEQDLEQGFKHLHYYFPEKVIPDIYTYVSGFNESVAVTDSFIGISLDKYLGVDCPFYGYLGIPRFKVANMYPEKIVPDVFFAWALAEFQYNDSIDNLLSQMIYNGKLMYFTEAMNPQLPDSLLMGYSSKKLEWCKNNEGLMWSYLVNKKMIYNSERLTIRKFIGDAPFTNVFTDKSPGRAGVWIGWQIVRSFMDNNEDVTLEQLMKMNNAQELLSQSKYFPD